MGYYHPLDEKLEQIEERLDDLLLILKDKQRTNPDQVFNERVMTDNKADMVHSIIMALIAIISFKVGQSMK